MNRIIAFILLLVAASGCASNPAVTARKSRADAVRGCFGTYDHEPRRADKRVDVEELVTELAAMHANTYHWLVWHNARDWDDLHTFLPLAREHGIRVWVTVVPPTEAPPHESKYSEPFRLDYERWATEIGKLSREQTNLVAWSIDDFSDNLKFFTPEKTRRMMELAQAENPRLAFVPCCYYLEVTPGMAKDYAPLLDGVLFPYRSESTKTNLKDARQVESEVDALRKLMGKSCPIVVDVYATPHNQYPDGSSPEYIEDVMRRARHSADGVLIYCHQRQSEDVGRYNVLERVFGEWTAAH